jgi:hypothetical protein
MGPNPTLTTGRGRSKTELNQMSLQDFDVEITHLKFTFPNYTCSAPSISVLSDSARPGWKIQKLKVDSYRK